VERTNNPLPETENKFYIPSEQQRLLKSNSLEIKKSNRTNKINRRPNHLNWKVNLWTAYL